MPLNVFFDWLVSDHVNKMAAVTDNDAQRNISTDILKLEEIGFTSNVIQSIFFEYAIFSTVCFAAQFFVTMSTWYFKENNQSKCQEILVWGNLFLNDLPQCVVTTIIVHGTGDVYMPYFCSTMLGVIGNYMVFAALSPKATFYYPNAMACHGLLVTICLITQIVLFIRAI